jgi:hypothetical protein
MSSQYSSTFTPRKRLTHARCACCGCKKDREPVLWKPGDPPISCADCKTAGCTHRWREFWVRGQECPARLRGRRLRACVGSAGGRR